MSQCFFLINNFYYYYLKEKKIEQIMLYSRKKKVKYSKVECFAFIGFLCLGADSFKFIILMQHLTDTTQVKF